MLHECNISMGKQNRKAKSTDSFGGPRTEQLLRRLLPLGHVGVSGTP